MTSKRVAIACQGGGTNAAFTYGALHKILETIAAGHPASNRQRFEIVALSGTSAGALNAFMTWYGLAAKGERPGGPSEAIAALNSLWDTFAAQTPAEVFANTVYLQALRAQARGLPSIKVSPYAPGYEFFLSRLDRLGFRREFYDFAALLDKLAPHFASIDQSGVTPRLLLGAVEVLSGEFVAFDSSADRASGRTISLAAVGASGTLPELHKAERISGARRVGNELRSGFFWDGLFSQNPPVRQFVTDTPLEDRPDEIWVIRINPQARDRLPTCPEDIEDRRNELAGNLSLNQELHFLHAVSRWCEGFSALGCVRKAITIRTLKMSKRLSERLDFASKFDRGRAFIDELRADGEAQAAAWLERWPHDLPMWPDDAGYGQE